MRQWILKFYALSLTAYPVRFQQEFGAEAQTVFDQALASAANDGARAVTAVCVRELRDWPASVLEAHRADWQRTERSAAMIQPSEGEPAGEHWLGALAGGLPFLLFGIASILSKLPAHYHPFEFLGFYLLMIAGVCVGWLRRFPRWSLIYVGWAVVFAWWWSGMGVGALGQRLGFGLGTDQWGWAAWAPIGLATGIGLLLSRSLRPLQALASRLWQDWTWTSLAAYILLAWLSLLADENHHPHLLILIAASAVATAVGASLYMYLDTAMRRGGGLLAAVGALALIGGYSESTWDWRAYYGLPASQQPPWLDALRWVVLLALWSGVLMSPALIGQWLRQRRRTNAAE
jgi:hypothetical protein